MNSDKLCEGDGCLTGCLGKTGQVSLRRGAPEVNKTVIRLSSQKWSPAI